MQLKSLIYNGPFPSVELALAEPVVLDEPIEIEQPLPDGTIGLVEVSVLHALVAHRGELCEYIPASTAESLEEQGNWLLPDGSLPEAAKPREERTFTVKELRQVAKEAGISVPAKATKGEIEELIAQHAREDAGESGAEQDTTDPGNPTASGEKE